MKPRSDLLRRLVLIGTGIACLVLAAGTVEAHDFFRRLLTGDQPMSDFPGTGWDQFAPLLSSLALVALGIIALVVGGPIGAALGLGVAAVSTYSSYKQGGWRQVLDDHNPFGHDFWDALLNPDLSARERLARLTFSAFKGASVVPGVRGAASGLQRFSSVARNVTPGLARGGGAPRRPPPPLAPLPGRPPTPARRARVPRDAMADDAAEKIAYLSSAKGRRDVERLWRRIEAFDDPQALARLGKEGLNVPAKPLGRFGYQVDPAGCGPAVISKQLERLGTTMSPYDVERRARALGLWTPGVGMTSNQMARFYRIHGFQVSKPGQYGMPQLGEDLRQGKQVTVLINNSSNPQMPNWHFVDLQASSQAGGGRKLLIGDPHSGAIWDVTRGQFGMMQPIQPVVVSR
jgi:hypothetical protein